VIPVELRTRRATRAVALAVFRIVLTMTLEWGCTGAGEPMNGTDPEDEPDTALDLCGAKLVSQPADNPVDACRHGVVALGPSTVARGTGTPPDADFDFTIAETSPSCIVIPSNATAGELRASAAWIEVDGDPVVAPDAFSQQVTTVEVPLWLTAGAHRMGVTIAGPPGSYLDVTVKTGGVGERFGVARSEHLEIFNTYAEPPFVSSTGALSLLAQGTVVRFTGLPSREGVAAYLVRWAFEIRDAASCDLVAVLPGESHAFLPSFFTAAASWDGSGTAGGRVTDGPYAVRLSARSMPAVHRASGSWMPCPGPRSSSCRTRRRRWSRSRVPPE
jgi:hypothetical protein